jgi:hypothetical protein
MAVEHCAALVEAAHANVLGLHTQSFEKRTAPILSAHSRTGTEYGVERISLRIEA